MNCIFTGNWEGKNEYKYAIRQQELQGWWQPVLKTLSHLGWIAPQGLPVFAFLKAVPQARSWKYHFLWTTALTQKSCRYALFLYAQILSFIPKNKRYCYYPASICHLKTGTIVQILRISGWKQETFGCKWNKHTDLSEDPLFKTDTSHPFRNSSLSLLPWDPVPISAPDFSCLPAACRSFGKTGTRGT